MRQPKAILFDLDCTLTDRRASLSKYASIFADRFQEHLDDVVDETTIFSRFVEIDRHGYLPRSKCWPYLLSKLKWKRPASTLELDELWVEGWPRCAVSAAGARELLERLAAAEISLGIITNGPADSQRNKIDTLGIVDLMDVVLVSGAFGVAKPQRAIFDCACQTLGLAPGEVWFVGDHPINDAVGARSAGLVDVWLTGYAPWPQEHQPATFSIEQLHQLPELLKMPLQGEMADV